MQAELDTRYGMMMSAQELELYQKLKPRVRALDDLVHSYIQQVFISTNYNRKVTAHLLGISRHALARRLRQQRKTKLG